MSSASDISLSQWHPEATGAKFLSSRSTFFEKKTLIHQSKKPCRDAIHGQHTSPSLQDAKRNHILG
jgi:hypothetical protein